MKRVGKKGEGRFERISWDEALDTVALRLREIAAAHGPQADPALLVRREHGPPRVRQHGPALLPRARGEPARPDHLLVGGGPRLQGHGREDDGLRPRGDRPRAPRRGLGREHRQLERAPLALRRGGAAARGAARVRGPLPLAHRGEVRPPPRALPGHGRRARARDDARRLPRRARGPGLARAAHGRPRGAARAGAGVDARARGGDDRPARGGDRGLRARVRDDAAVGHPPQLRPEPPRRGRHGGADGGLPARGGGGLARRRRRGAPLDLGHLPGGRGRPRAARPRPPGHAHAQHEPARARPDRRDARAAGEGALRLQLEPRRGGARAGRGAARARARGPLRGRPRAVPDGHRRLRRHPAAGHHDARALRPPQGLRPPLRQPEPPGDRAARRGAAEHRALPPARRAHGARPPVPAGVGRADGAAGLQVGPPLHGGDHASSGSSARARCG